MKDEEWQRRLSAGELIAQLEDTIKDQDRLIDVLKAALAASGKPEDLAEMAEPWAGKLTRQEGAFIGALLGAYPRIVNHFALLEMLPSRDEITALDRDVKMLSVLVLRVREKLGKGAVETVRGVGYRMGDAFYASIRPDSNRVVPLKAA